MAQPHEAASDAPAEPGSFMAAMQEAMRASEEQAGSLAPDPEPTKAVTPAEPRQDAPIEPTDDIVEAWHRWLEGGRGVPAGLAAFLRSSEVRPLEDGSLEVRPIPGPAYERISAAPVLDALTEGLTPYLGRRPVLAIAAPADGENQNARITREEVREDTLRALYRQEPRLERAVQELDLELMD